MAIGVTVEVDASKLERAARELNEEFRTERLLKRIGQAHLFWINENFRGAGALFGAWRPLRPNTLANPKRGGAGSQPLRSSQRLAMSFIVGDPDNLFAVGANEVVVGTEVEYAKFHEFGTRGPYPIRPVRRKALAFWTTAGLVFRRQVLHPGLPVRKLLPPQDFADNTAKVETEQYLADMIRKAERGAR